METLSWPIPQRIAHYRSEADRLRCMADAEPIEAIRDELLATARQYQQLADGLKTGAPFIPETHPSMVAEADDEARSRRSRR